MAEVILGLPTSAKFAAESDRFYNHRRKILHLYPRGGAPLTGILSNVPAEETNDSMNIWYEKRYKSPQCALRGTNPITTDAPSTGDANDGTAATTGAKAISTDFYLKVDTTKDLRIGHIMELSTDRSIQFWITAVTRGVSAEASNGYVKVRLLRAATFGTIATYFPATTLLYVIGSAYGEGASGANVTATGIKRPYAIMNTTQIFRDAMTFSGSVLQMGLKYDQTGPYKEKARDTIVDHMTSLERSLIWGKRSSSTRSSFDSTQEDLNVRTMSGIIEFLELWDAGSTGLTIDGATYAPYAFKGQSTSDSDDQKRIIDNTSGIITVEKWNRWAERVGRYHTNRTNEKLVLCGSGALLAMCDMFRKNTHLEVTMNDTAYGLEFHTLKTPFGKFHFVSHPLFNENSTYRYWALILDIWSLKWRPLLNRDTKLLKMRQNNGDDFRKDEYLTEGSLEFWTPESHMLIKNITRYAATE